MFPKSDIIQVYVDFFRLTDSSIFSWTPSCFYTISWVSSSSILWSCCNLVFFSSRKPREVLYMASVQTVLCSVEINPLVHKLWLSLGSLWIGLDPTTYEWCKESQRTYATIAKFDVLDLVSAWEFLCFRAPAKHQEHQGSSYIKDL